MLETSVTQKDLASSRLILEAVTEHHAEELRQLFSDPELHRYVPLDPPALVEMQERCRRWQKRVSPSGEEIWLNWAARERASGDLVGHLQVGVDLNRVGTIGYLIGRGHQKKGFAKEAWGAIFPYLKTHFDVIEIRAFSDTRNLPSHRLALALGMQQVELLHNADFFKGSSSDEFVFSKRL